MGFKRHFKPRSTGSTPIPGSASDQIERQSFDQCNDTTAHYYARRNDLLSGLHHAEWWMAVGVLLIVAGIGFVVL